MASGGRRSPSSTTRTTCSRSGRRGGAPPLRARPSWAGCTWCRRDPRSADGRAFLEALAEARDGIGAVSDPAPGDDVRLVLAPDLLQRGARGRPRAVLRALEEGVGPHRVAVLHGADPAYARLLREALAAAEIPVAAMPGMPLVETPPGAGCSRCSTSPRRTSRAPRFIDALSVAPMRRELPAGGATARCGSAGGTACRGPRGSPMASGGGGRGSRRSATTVARRSRTDRGAGRRPTGSGTRSPRRRSSLAVVETLVDRLRDLRRTPGGRLPGRLRAIVRTTWIPARRGWPRCWRRSTGWARSTPSAAPFSLARFATALRGVNLEAAALRDGRAGEGVLVGDHRIAAGLRFARVVLCGAAEGLLPAGPGTDALVPDAAWRSCAGPCR